jgi:fructose-1,6-bisphosphatase I
MDINTKHHIKKIEKTLQSYSLQIYDLLQQFDFSSDIINDSASEKINESGDSVVELDEEADKISELCFEMNPLIYGFISEERKDIVITNKYGNYIITIDPLDGSQNIRVGLNVGAIFGIYKTNNYKTIKNGNDLVAAGYVLFSTSIQFVFTLETTSYYRYNFKTTDWCLVKTNLKIPDGGSIYSINEGYSDEFYYYTKIMLKKLKNDPAFVKPRSSRWMCCMVADIHRNLMDGGCFLYPCNKISSGKLRLVYELYPMAFIWESCGGKALINITSEKPNILDIPFPYDNLHKKHGCYFLGKYEYMLLCD